MKNDDRIDIHKDLSSNLKSNLEIHLKKLIGLFKILVCNKNIDNLDNLLEKQSYANCEITHMLNAVLNSKIKTIDDKKDKILNLEGEHERLHKLQNSLLLEYGTSGTVGEQTYEDFAILEFQFMQNLTTLVIESENYEKNFDGLTNIFNRKYFFEKIEYDFSKARLTRTDFTIVMADIDYFKKINDTYGHQVGDQVLVEISRIFVEHIRAYDIVARYGGEEFIFFMYTDAKETVIIFNRIQSLLKSEELQIGNHRIQLNCSFGVAQDRNDSSVYELVTLADKALFEAKTNGRNRIEII
ncbi:MAG: diguanylate cyclase (GGDEF)-like protein [Sulfurimonas sp.]|jgi:diguanylate cyclase (GGDEF)-like protein|uniref:GGDEF domain-containing protein n=1 Tax=Sulfurimonas sp. TaxID=2022749 RepID=UPI0039E6B406